MADDPKDDGGPAFPACGPSFGRDGMSLRDWFAAQVLAVLLAADKEAAFLEAADRTGRAPTSVVADLAYEFADSMLLARGE